MNLKSRIISLSLVIVLSVFVSGSVYSQGIFKNDKSKTTEQSTTTDQGVLKDSGTTPGDESPGLQSTPVGEGLAILSLLSGCYFMLKKRRNTKE